MATKKTEAPEQVVLASMYAFYDDDGAFHLWQEGQSVTAADDIAMLIDRKAPLKESDE